MPTEPQVVWMPGGVRTEIHLTGDDTGGSFCLLVDHPHPGWSLPPHIHEDTAEGSAAPRDYDVPIRRTYCFD